MLLSTQRIGVFVTGFVRTPGRFAGWAADSVIDFLCGPAASIPAAAPTARSRCSVAAARWPIRPLPLPDGGRLPPVRRQEGDTWWWRGSVPWSAPMARCATTTSSRCRPAMTGRELIDYARPLPSATNAIVKGTRGGQPYSRYATLAELGGPDARDQDTVTFITDSPARTVRVTSRAAASAPRCWSPTATRSSASCSTMSRWTRRWPIPRRLPAAALGGAAAAPGDRRGAGPAGAAALHRGVPDHRRRGDPGIGGAAGLLLIQRARRTQPEGRLVVADRTAAAPRCGSRMAM